MSVQPNYNATLDEGYEGQIADTRLSDVVSRVCEPASIGFGKAVIRGTDPKQVKLGAAGEFIGITVRDIALPAANSDVYTQYDNVGVMVKGSMFVTAAAAVTFGDPVYRTPTGTLTNVPGTRTATFGTPVGDGNGTLSAIVVDATTPPKAGTYTVHFFEAETDLGDFEVIRDADGAVVGVGKVGTAFDNGGLGFTIGDSSTDWALGTTIPITVVGGNTLIEGATWEQSASQNAIAKIRLN